MNMSAALQVVVGTVHARSLRTILHFTMFMMC